MSADRPDILWARGHVHIEKVIMSNVWVRDGDWNSIRLVSQRVLSPQGLDDRAPIVLSR